jgi:hypothetical protein
MKDFISENTQKNFIVYAGILPVLTLPLYLSMLIGWGMSPTHEAFTIKDFAENSIFPLISMLLLSLAAFLRRANQRKLIVISIVGGINLLEMLCILKSFV